MSIARRIAALAIVAAGVYALDVFCVLPWRCNLVRKARAQATDAAYNAVGSPEARIAARRNLDAVLPCTSATCRDIAVDMLAAANYRLLGQNDTAVQFYEHALRLDRRPEILMNLGVTELAAGDRAAARRHLLQASLFNVYMVAQIEDGVMRQEVVKELIALRPENADFIRYADSLTAAQ